MTLARTTTNLKPTGMPYLDGAACTNIPHIMDGTNSADVHAGLDACCTCPAFGECDRWVNSLTPPQKRNLLNGVVAGRVWGESKRWMTPRDRKLHTERIPR